MAAETCYGPVSHQHPESHANCTSSRRNQRINVDCEYSDIHLPHAIRKGPNLSSRSEKTFFLAVSLLSSYMAYSTDTGFPALIPLNAYWSRTESCIDSRGNNNAL